MGNEMFQARIPDDFAEKIHEYREEKHMSKSEAVRDLLRRGLEADQKPEPIPDGGYLRRSDHPWIDPLVNFAYHTAGAGMWILLISMLALAIPSGAIEWFGAELSQETAALFLSVFTLGMIASTVMVVSVIVALVILEYLMHPSEAPIRRYFYTTDPAEDDTVIA